MRADNPLPRVAVVIHRFVEDAGGGAEEHCRRLVHSLKGLWDIDVLTTRARDHHTWADELPGGEERGEGFRVIRFPVERKKRRVLSALLPRTLLRMPHPRWLELAWVRALGPHCPELLEFLEREGPNYRAVIFYTYLYATTVLGLPRAGPRTLLIPTAHDEPALRMPIHRAALLRPGALAFLSPEERDLVRRVAGPGTSPELILGAELDPRAWLPGDGEAFRLKYGVVGPFLLYLGRIERSKGLKELLSIWDRLGERLPALILAGRRGPLNLPRSARYLGYLPEADKRGALAASSALVMPSARESLSLVVLEAWAQRRPVIVNRRCAVLAGQCRRAGGGLGYATCAEFAEAAARLNDPACRAALGEGGHRYARATCGEGSLRARLVPFLEGLGWFSTAGVPEAARASPLACP